MNRGDGGGSSYLKSLSPTGGGAVLKVQYARIGRGVGVAGRLAASHMGRGVGVASSLRSAPSQADSQPFFTQGPRRDVRARPRATGRTAARVASHRHPWCPDRATAARRRLQEQVRCQLCVGRTRAFR